MSVHVRVCVFISPEPFVGKRGTSPSPRHTECVSRVRHYFPRLQNKYQNQKIGHQDHPLIQATAYVPILLAVQMVSIALLCCKPRTHFLTFRHRKTPQAHLVLFCPVPRSVTFPSSTCPFDWITVPEATPWVLGGCRHIVASWPRSLQSKEIRLLTLTRAYAHPCVFLYVTICVYIMLNTSSC